MDDGAKAIRSATPPKDREEAEMRADGTSLLIDPFFKMAIIFGPPNLWCSIHTDLSK